MPSLSSPLLSPLLSALLSRPPTASTSSSRPLLLWRWRQPPNSRARLGVSFRPLALPSSAPHRRRILQDDLGWANVGFNRANKTQEVQTPNIDKLVAEGVHLLRHCQLSPCASGTVAL